MSTSPFPQPQKGGSLLLAFKPANSALLIVGSNNVAAARAFAALEADYDVIVTARGGLSSACPEIQHRASRGEITFVDLDLILSDLLTVGGAVSRLLADHPNISLACVTDTILPDDTAESRTFSSAREIYDTCHLSRVPINITDVPELCDFTFPVSHRFQDPKSGESTPLQISITTNGKGCSLGSRIKREILSYLPKTVGVAVQNVGHLRQLAKLESAKIPSVATPTIVGNEAETNISLSRMQWIAQLSEFWPLEHLARLTEGQMLAILDEHKAALAHPRTEVTFPEAWSSTKHALFTSDPLQRKGKIFLIGSGLGHPALLTLASYKVLTQMANLVLSDKLVPAPILELIPHKVDIVIARKYPGNADNAQNELMEKAVEAASRGQLVVRLKQGDPMVYGRAGEEIMYFREQGFEPIVIPGISASIAGPAFANIPVTQRGVSESVIVCTGVGRGGKEVDLPGYRRERTVVVLMGVARLSQVVEVLCEPKCDRRDGAPYPSNVPIAIIERASMPDQRIVSSTLQDIEKCFQHVGDQRPPGMIVIGWAVLALYGKGNLDVLKDSATDNDSTRIRTWLGPAHFKVSEGLADIWANELSLKSWEEFRIDLNGN